jgi:hypothetical protein
LDCKRTIVTWKKVVVVVMDPLRAVENMLGPVERWPTHILFVVEDTDARTMKNVAAFTYGNDVPVHMASERYFTLMGIEIRA